MGRAAVAAAAAAAAAAPAAAAAAAAVPGRLLLHSCVASASCERRTPLAGILWCAGASTACPSASWAALTTSTSPVSQHWWPAVVVRLHAAEPSVRWPCDKCWCDEPLPVQACTAYCAFPLAQLTNIVCRGLACTAAQTCRAWCRPSLPSSATTSRQAALIVPGWLWPVLLHASHSAGCRTASGAAGLRCSI